MFTNAYPGSAGKRIITKMDGAAKLSSQNHDGMPYFYYATNNIYSGHHYPKENISHIVWLYHHFTVG